MRKLCSVRRGRNLLSACAIWMAISVPASCFAGGGPLGIDSQLTLDQSGIWARKYQNGLETAVIATEVVGALWLGNDDKLGHTFWQTIDASVISGLSAQALKYATGRPRPYQSMQLIYE